MDIIKKITIETNSSRFEVSISEKDNGKELSLEYYGTTPKFAQIMSPGESAPTIREVGSGVIIGDDIDSLIAQCRDEIEKIDGDIVLEHES